MSHWTTIKTQIRDVDALRAACAELGLQMFHKSIARGYYTNELPAEYVIRCKGPYDIAIDRTADGTFALKTDWYAGHVEKEVGENFKRLVQLYGVNKATMEARRKGLTVTRQTLGNGSIKLAIAGGAL